MGISQASTNNTVGDSEAEEEGEKLMVVEAAGEGEELDEGASAVNVEYILDAEAAETTKKNETTKDGSF